jgi:thiol-disulfide isomerase/thioredoxin
MKTNNILIAILLIVTIFSSCGRDGFSVKGKLEGMQKQKYQLVQLNPKEMVIIDSGYTKEDGTFSIEGKNTEPALYRLKFEQGKYILLTLGHDKAEIFGDWNNLENYKVEGSEGSKVLKSFLVQLSQHVNDIKSLEKVTENLSKRDVNKDSMMKEIQADVKNINSSFVNYVKQFADTTTLMPNAVFAANILNAQVEEFYLKTFFGKLAQRYPNSAAAKEMVEVYSVKYADAKEPTQSTYIKKADGKYKVIPKDAEPATDISGETPDGKQITLASFRGKYVLIDFWASWCPPCRAENPKVLSVYRMFKDKNFTILGVSLDDNKDEWVKAIKDDGLAWTQISELKRWSSVIARDYNIKNIPSNVLVNPDGIIIARNLRGDELEKTLESELMN